MEIAVAPLVSADLGSRFLQAWVEDWLKTCAEFRRWERENLILKRPSKDTIAEHGKLIRTLIWGARVLQAIIADPDCRARQMRPEIDGLLRQLEETSEMIHHPMTDDECEALIRKYFPDEPGTGRAPAGHGPAIQASQKT
jgi:hypothetical protein